VWLGSSKRDLADFPDEVEDEVGHHLYEAQQGKKPENAKPLKGYRGASVLEIVEDFDTDTYRAVYTVEFEEAIYVLHCFMKKSKRGSGVPKRDADVIEQRYKRAKEEHRKWKKWKVIEKAK